MLRVLVLVLVLFSALWRTLRRVRRLFWDADAFVGLGGLRPGDVLSGPLLGCGIGGPIVVVAQQKQKQKQKQKENTLCASIAPDPAGVQRVSRLYLLRSDRRVPAEAVAHGRPLGIPELVRAAERALHARRARIDNSWHESWDFTSMLDITRPGGASALRFLDSDAARRHLAAATLQIQHAARVVQRGWRRAAADPAMRVCRDRLLREFRELRELRELRERLTATRRVQARRPVLPHGPAEPRVGRVLASRGARP